MDDFQRCIRSLEFWANDRGFLQWESAYWLDLKKNVLVSLTAPSATGPIIFYFTS